MRNLIVFFTIILSTSITVFASSYFKHNSHFPAANSVEISLLTYSQGTEIYSLFGHSSIRVHNKNRNTDMVYNYGTFDFDQPNFYFRFIQGNLDYMLTTKPYEVEVYRAQRDNISIIETPLALTNAEKQAITSALHINLLPENRNYRYDFLFDNCATRIIDIVEKAINDSLILNPEVVPKKTFRQLIHEYTKTRPWAELGIDILMGIPVDKKTQHTEPAFLPDYLHLIIKNLHTSSPPRNITITHADRLVFEEFSETKAVKISPSLIFFLLSVMFLLSGFVDSYFRRFFLITGNWLMFIVGIISILLIYLWLATNHYIFQWNVDLLWANPILILLFIIRAKNGSFKRVVLIISIVLCCLGALISYLIQHSAATASIAITLAIHLYILYRNSYKKNTLKH